MVECRDGFAIRAGHGRVGDRHRGVSAAPGWLLMVTGRQAEHVPDVTVWQRAWTGADTPAPVPHQAMIDAITHCLEPRGRRVLEVGVGTGGDSVALAMLGAEVYAVDITREALGLTRRLGGQRGVSVHLVCGDTLRLPFRTGSFDLVFSQGLLEHFSDPLAVLAEQARIVRQGGYLLVDVPQRYSLYTLQKRRFIRQGRWFAGWETEFSLTELMDLVTAAGLRPMRTYGYGYAPSILLGLRYLHTIDQRRALPVRLPTVVRSGVERIWRQLEAVRGFHRWLVNIGVIAQKV